MVVVVVVCFFEGGGGDGWKWQNKWLLSTVQIPRTPFFSSSCVPDLFSENCVKFSQLIAPNILCGGKRKTYRHAHQNLHNGNNIRDFKFQMWRLPKPVLFFLFFNHRSRISWMTKRWEHLRSSWKPSWPTSPTPVRQRSAMLPLLKRSIGKACWTSATTSWTASVAPVDTQHYLYHGIHFYGKLLENDYFGQDSFVVVCVCVLCGGCCVEVVVGFSSSSFFLGGRGGGDRGLLLLLLFLLGFVLFYVVVFLLFVFYRKKLISKQMNFFCKFERLLWRDEGFATFLQTLCEQQARARHLCQAGIWDHLFCWAINGLGVWKRY